MRARPVPWSYVAADPARRPIIVPLRNQSNKGKVFSKVLPFVHDGGPFGTVPELLFDKKHLISTLQQILSSTGKTDISLL